MSAELQAATKRQLVKVAEEILNKVQDERDFREQTAQLRNLLQITQEESEVPVLRNFIRYQTGRKATQRFWNLIHEPVIRQLEDIENQHPDDAERKLAIQHFFGYLVRHYVYLNEVAKERRRQQGGRP